MHTQTHLLISAAALTRPGDRERNIAAIAGAVLPDVPMFVMVGYGALAGLTGEQIFGEYDGLYWTPGWQGAINGGHSIPIYLAILAIAFWLKRAWLKAFCYSAFLHISFDLPFHFDDAHAHFWPLTNWKFMSPVSYWDRAHYGGVVMPLEIAGSLILIAILVLRFPVLWVKIVLGLLAALYIGGPLYFILSRG